jgi:hypothetical protein
MNKCTICQEEKSVEAFAWKNKAGGVKHSRCKECQREVMKNHYRANKRYYIKKADRQQEKMLLENRTMVYEYLLQHPCVDCGETDPVILEFDHVKDKKEQEIAKMIAHCSWARIGREIEKCDVRCCNCHTRKTAKERGYWKYLWKAS